MTQLLSPPSLSRPSPVRPRKSSLECRIATSNWERLAAHRLVYEHYLNSGLIAPNPFRYRVTPHHLLPTTQVFLALREERPICTVSLVGDGALGLPMESIYREEVSRSRSQGLFVGEVSALAGCTTDFRSFLPIFVQLTRLMAQYARKQGMHQFLIAVHPKHAGFYERFLGFEQIGPVREYPSVHNAPAVACCLDFDRIDRERPKCWHDFFGTPLPPSQLETAEMDEDELRDYQAVVDFHEAMRETGTLPVKASPRDRSGPIRCGR